MAQSSNRSLRRQKSAGLALLALVAAFVAATAAGVVFPDAGSPERATVQFEVGTRFADAEEAKIAAVADRLLDAPTTIAVITGHTGPDGDAAANLALSSDRAAAVRDGLIAAGIPAERIRIRGAGGAEPPDLTPGASAAERTEATRRAEIRLVERRLLAPGSGA